MKTMTIRGIEPELGRNIKASASHDSLSVNQWILRVMRQSVGLGDKRHFRRHDDLDALAGGWSRKEADRFLKDISIFEEIDGEVWK